MEIHQNVNSSYLLYDYKCLLSSLCFFIFRDQIANIRWIMEKARQFQKKTSISALLTMPMPLTVWITINCGKL